jgi:hypothetical protein
MTLPQAKTKRPGGMFGFGIVWLGQIVSVLATNMSGFALTIWAFEKTSSATVLGLVQLSLRITAYHPLEARGNSVGFGKEPGIRDFQPWMGKDL